MSRHDWTEDDEYTLIETMQRLEPMLDHYRSLGRRASHDGHRPSSWWDAVAGALVAHPDWSGGVVSGEACRTRHQKIMAALVAEDGPTIPAAALTLDSWAALEAQIEEYERSVAERTEDTADEILARVTRIEMALRAVCRDLGLHVVEEADDE